MNPKYILSTVWYHACLKDPKFTVFDDNLHGQMPLNKSHFFLLQIIEWLINTATYAHESPSVQRMAISNVNWISATKTNRKVEMKKTAVITCFCMWNHCAGRKLKIWYHAVPVSFCECQHLGDNETITYLHMTQLPHWSNTWYVLLHSFASPSQSNLSLNRSKSPTPRRNIKKRTCISVEISTLWTLFQTLYFTTNKGEIAHVSENTIIISLPEFPFLISSLTLIGTISGAALLTF